MGFPSAKCGFSFKPKVVKVHQMHNNNNNPRIYMAPLTSGVATDFE